MPLTCWAYGYEFWNTSSERRSICRSACRVAGATQCLQSAWCKGILHDCRCTQGRYMGSIRLEMQNRRWTDLHAAVSPKGDRGQAVTSASGPAQRMPDSHGGRRGADMSASSRTPEMKPMSRQAISAVLCTVDFMLGRCGYVTTSL